ncbi:MAG: exodeoxyribonuclease VII small subunit [Ruthenibacterium sp.]
MTKAKMSYESASAELDAILGQLSSEDTTLEDALKLYAKAAELIAFCNQTLQNAQIQVDEISAKLQREDAT